MSTRDISAHLAKIYGVTVGRDLISWLTRAAVELYASEERVIR
jgi:hypothetical protein